MKNFIPLSVPNFCGNELKYVSDAVSTSWVSTGGGGVSRFEEEIAKYLKVDGAVACQSGTSGLHIALILAGIETLDEVIVPTLTFIAAVNPVRYCGATPIFMDCDDNLCLNATKLEQFIYEEAIFKDGNLINKSSNRMIKALIYVHVFGLNSSAKRTNY